MAKNIKREISLIDYDGAEWVRAYLSETRLRAILKVYEKQGIHLREKVSA
jgi:hypothetical protein